jgi:hypothetical protein
MLEARTLTKAPEFAVRLEKAQPRFGRYPKVKTPQNYYYGN